MTGPMIKGRITDIGRDRPPSLAGSSIAKDARPHRVIDSMTLQTDDGVTRIEGPFTLYGACAPFIEKGQTVSLTLFDPTPTGFFKGAYRDGSRPLAAVLTCNVDGQTMQDTAAIKAAVDRVKKDLAISAGNKWFVGIILMSLGIVLADLYRVWAGHAVSPNPELLAWGLIGPLILARMFWYRRRLKHLEKASLDLLIG